MLPADLLNEGLGSLVGKHGEVGPHVVLNLVIEVSVQKVIDVTSGPEVNTGKNLSEEERSTERSASITEAVHVVSCVVSNNSYKPVKVGEELSEEKILYCGAEHVLNAKVLSDEKKG